MILRIVCLLLSVLLYSSSANAWVHGNSQSPLANLANSQLNPNYIYLGEGIFSNALKWGSDWIYSDNSIHALPTDLDANGYPINGTGGFSHGGYKLTISGISSQFERPGNWVILGSGRGSLQAFDESATTSTGVVCAGTQSGANNIICNNASCGTITGSISGQVLTVTGAPSCSILLYQAVSNGSTTTNQFGVPTMVIGKSGSANCPACTGAGGAGTYLVNWSQTVSGPFIPGFYNELSATAEVARGTVQWDLALAATDATNPISNMGFVHANDLLAYAQGQLTGTLFKLRVQQGNFAYIRDLNTAVTNVSSVTTWATRKPAAYFSYNAPEMRSSTFAGASTYALNGSSNDYSVNLGAALPVDKQTVCATVPTNNTNSTVTFSVDNGVTKYPILDFHGGAVGTFQTYISLGLVFNRYLNTWFSTNGGGCIVNGVPPEAFVQINREMGTAPWIVEPMYSSDPITDYPTQYATLVNGFSWTNPPLFEVPDETWNCAGQGVAQYATVMSRAYIAADATWSSNASGHHFCGASGDIENWTGKVGSILGQAIRQVSSSFPVIMGVQTVGNASSGWNAVVLSTSYVGQNTANIPIQTGCAGPSAVQTGCLTPWRQTAAYVEMKGSLPYSSAITIANYWSLNYQATTAGLQTEVALAYCYFYQSGGCSSQSSIMTSYFTSQPINANFLPGAGSSTLSQVWTNWYNFARTCAGGSSCTPMAVYNYEGTYTVGTTGLSDQTASVTGATNVAQAVLTINPNGCVAGQTVALTAASGGTWSSALGSYTVQSATSSTCTINLNSSGLGTLTSGTLSYTGSSNYVAYLRKYSWLAADLATWSTTLFNAISGTSGPCTPAACSKFPSQFNFSSDQGSFNWFTWSPDLYGYFTVASCSSCSAAAGNLTLGGTVSGIFKSGLTILGGGISGVTITGACSQTGSLPAGANAGDVCPISSGVASATSKSMNATVAPAANASANSTTSPIKQWGAICKWNGNTNQCDGI